MPEQLWFTALLNRAFGRPVSAAMQALPPPFHPKYPEAPITNPVAMEILVIVILLVFFLLLRSRLSVQKPRGLQHLFEMFNDFITKQTEDIIEHEGLVFVPFLSALFLFVLIGNLLGLVPSLESPTRYPAIPMGCALVTFVYYNLYGLRKQGIVGYFKSFLGPVWWLSPLMFPIEVFSNLARVMSLTIRLYANMFAGDVVTLVFFSLIPIGVPVIFLGLHLGVSLLQAYIFTLLSTVYLGLAVAHEH